jgi:hypothetical protein
MPLVDSMTAPVTLDPQENLAEGDSEISSPSERKKRRRASSSSKVHSESLACIAMSHLNINFLPKQL